MSSEANATGGQEVSAPVENSTPAKEMRCVTLSGYGGIRMVKVTKTPELEAKEGELLIRVRSW
jgi:hypothetical protein